MDGEHENSWFAGIMRLLQGLHVRPNHSYGASNRETEMEDFA
jgi:hypothetical protein